MNWFLLRSSHTQIIRKIIYKDLQKSPKSIMKKNKNKTSFSEHMIEKPPMKIINAEKNNDEWRIDTKGYFLIDPRKEEQCIYAHFYTKEKKYQVSIKGKNAEEIYYTILREELVSSLMHAAYIGSELQKAEYYLKINKTEQYVQDEEIIKS